MLILNNGKVEHVKPVPLRIVKSKREITMAWNQILNSLSGDQQVYLKNELDMIAETLEIS